MKLYELADQYRQLKDALEQCETARDSEEHMNLVDFAEERIDAIADAFDVKVQNVALVIKELEAEADMIDGEVKRLQARNKSRVNSIDWLKRYLYDALIMTKTDKVEGPMTTVSLRKCPTSVAIVEDDMVPSEFVTQETVMNIDKKAILKHFKDTGEIVAGCEFTTDKRTLQVK